MVQKGTFSTMYLQLGSYKEQKGIKNLQYSQNPQRATKGRPDDSQLWENPRNLSMLVWLQEEPEKILGNKIWHIYEKSEI